MADTVISSGGYLIRNNGAIIDLTGGFSYILAIKLTTIQGAGVYRAGFVLKDVADGGFTNVYQYPPDALGGGLVTELNTPGFAALLLGDNPTLDGVWVHLGFTWNAGTTDQFLYALTEGFNSGAPAFLIPPANAGTEPAWQPNPTTAFVWTDDLFGSDPGIDVALGHVIIVDSVLTQAEIIAQFQQRAPTATVMASNYTYLDMLDPATVEVDMGSTAQNFAKTPGFAVEAGEPSEWAIVPPPPTPPVGIPIDHGLVKLERSFAYRLWHWLPNPFVHWIDLVSRSLDIGVQKSWVSFPDFPAGGAIGSALATVDGANVFFVAQTTAAQTLSLPNPTSAIARRVLYVVNTGNQSFSIFGAALAAGNTAAAIWTGASYDRVTP